MDRRVFVTGMGIVSPLGLDAKSTWEAVTGHRQPLGPGRQIDLGGRDGRTFRYRLHHGL
jgi:3-oxoacyl-(acyl-carrier-protein) synthase